MALHASAPEATGKKQDNAGNGTCAETAEAVRVGKLSDGTFKHLADVLVKNEIGLSV